MDTLDPSKQKSAKTGRASSPPRRDSDAIAVGPEAAPSALLMSMVSVALVLLAGFALYLPRGGVVPSLDSILPTLRFPASHPGEVEEGTTGEPGIAESELAPELNLVCSPQDLDAAVRPLAEEVEKLLAAGRSEIDRFKGMSGQGGRAQALRNQWAGWGGIWRNRVALLRTAQPPRSACAERQDLAPNCDLVDSVLYLLEQVPSAQSVPDAVEIFTQGQEILEEFRRTQLEMIELAHLEEEVAAENLAALEAARGAVAVGGADQSASVPP